MSRRVLALALTFVVAGTSACSLSGSSEEPDVVAYFSNVGDLVEGGTVQVNDVEIGRITDISLELDDGDMVARVSMAVAEDEYIPAEGIEAVVRQTSLLGEQFVQLVPVAADGPSVGDAPIVIPIERTDRRVDIETFLADLSGLVGGGGLEDLNAFTHAQALILEGRGSQLGETLEELEKFTTVLARRRLDIGAAISSLASASGTVADNKDTLDSFLDSLDDANALLAEQGDSFGRLFRSLRRFGTVSSRFLVKHEDAIDRQFRALRPIFRVLAGASGELRTDIVQLRAFLRLFPKSLGGGPGGKGAGDYVQVEAVLCETFVDCESRGEKGDVPGEGQ